MPSAQAGRAWASKRMDRSSPEPPAAQQSRVPVLIAVTRTGGFAGLRREWRAEPTEDQASEWIELISQCPWDAVTAAAAPTGADRFMWRILARCRPDDERCAELPDEQVTGAWRDLVDAVRGWTGPG